MTSEQYPGLDPVSAGSTSHDKFSKGNGSTCDSSKQTGANSDAEQAAEEDAAKLAHNQSQWEEALPLSGTPGEVYLTPGPATCSVDCQ